MPSLLYYLINTDYCPILYIIDGIVSLWFDCRFRLCLDCVKMKNTLFLNHLESVVICPEKLHVLKKLWIKQMNGCWENCVHLQQQEIHFYLLLISKVHISSVNSSVSLHIYIYCIYCLENSLYIYILHFDCGNLTCTFSLYYPLRNSHNTVTLFKEEHESSSELKVNDSVIGFSGLWEK